VDATVAFQEFLEAMPDGIFVTDRDGRIAFLNQQAEAMSGYVRQELIGRPIEVLVPAAARPEHIHHRRRYYESGPAPRPMGTHLDIHVRRKDGGEFPADISLGPVRLGRRLLVVAAVRDVSERHRTEARLRQAEERHRRLVDGVSDHAIFMLDAEGRVASWNPGAERIYGHRDEEILGRPLAALYPAEAADRGQALLGQARSRGRAEDEGWQLRRDGSRFWANAVVAPLLDEAGLLRGYSAVTRDATERRRTEQSLQAALEVAQAVLQGRGRPALLETMTTQARTLVDADLAAVLLADGEGDGIVRAADGDGADRLLGLRLVEQTPAPIRLEAAGPGPDSDDRTRAALQALASAAGLGPVVLVPLAAGERRLGGLLVGNQVGGAAFASSGLRHLELFAAQAAIALDYERVQAELGRLALAEDRERIGRELHDGAIQALFAVGMNLEGAASTTEDPRLRQRLDAAVDQIDEVIRDLRNYIFGLRPGVLAGRGLEAALRDLAAEAERESGVEMTVETDRRLAAALAPRAPDLVQMTRELLSNVVRHARATSCRIDLRERQGWAVLEVADDGRGFDPGEATEGGWGLRNLRERTGGLGARLEIRSRLGRGTTVSVAVPLEAAAAFPVGDRGRGGRG
jgi:PAS domain S-box-containing protein